MKKGLLVLLVIFMATLAFANSAKEKANEVTRTGLDYKAGAYEPMRDVVYETGFEDAAMPAGWTVINNDGDLKEWSILETASAHSGANVVKVSYNSDGNDDWLISPLMTVDADKILYFWAKSSSSYYLEDFNVLISTTGNSMADFTSIESITSHPATWEEHSYDLSSYAGGIYVAIQCVSVDESSLYLDDFSVKDVPTEPIASINYTSVDFDETEVGNTINPFGDALELSNVQVGTLTITSITDLSGTAFTTNFDTSITLEADSSYAFGFEYTPTAAQADTAYFEIVTNGGTVGIGLKGSGYQLAVDQIQVGDDTYTGTNLPVEPYFNYSYTQSVYLQEDLNVADKAIETLGYRYTGSAHSDSIKIFMGYTTEDTLSSWIPITELTQVFDGQLATEAGLNWLELELDAPFNYNNSDNLVIAFYEVQAGCHSSSDDFFASPTENTRSLTFYSDSTFPDPATPPTANLRSYLPNTRIQFIDAVTTPGTLAGTVTLSGTADVTTVAITVDGNTFNPAADGAYSATLNAGTYTLTAELAGYDAHSEDITITADETLTVDIALTETPAPVVPTVFFSEYIEGSSNNKALEIYNGTDAEISLADFRVNQSNNGDDWAIIHTFPADAVIAAGDVWVMMTNQVDSLLYLAENADEVLPYNADDKVVHFNGNDARGLEYSADGTNWEVIDVIGIPTSDIEWAVAGVDPGTQNHTLVRKNTVLEGNTDWAASAGTTVDDSEWIVYDIDTFDYLGSHNESSTTEGTLSGTVTLADGAGVVTEVVITAGTATVSPAADGTYSIVLTTGTYDVTATLTGYATFTQADVVIADGAVITLDISLSEAEEMIAPTNVEVNEYSAVMTWTAPGTGGGTGVASFSDDFEGDLSAWNEVIEGAGTIGDAGNPYWYAATPPAAYDGNALLCDWGYSIDTWVITPLIAVEAATVVQFDWNLSYTWYVDPNANGDLFIKVSTDGENWDTLWHEEDYGVFENFTWITQNIDLSSYAGQDVYVAINNVGDDNGQAVVDNFYVGTNPTTREITFTPNVYTNEKSTGIAVASTVRNTRELTGYEVLLDGASVATVTETTYTFAGLTYDQEYVAGVKAVYDNGTSELVTYTFTYAEELELDAPANLTADEGLGSISWLAPGTSTGLASFSDDFEGDLSAWNEVIEGAGTIGDAGNAYWYAATPPAAYEGNALLCDWGYSIDTWVITPLIAVEAATVVQFDWNLSYTWYVDPNANGDLFIKVSTDGENWDTLWVEEDYGVFENFTWITQNIDLSSYAGQDVYVAINNVGDDNGQAVVDNFYVGTNPTTREITFTPNVYTNEKSTGLAVASAVRSTRDLTGYEVFLDGASVATDITELTYTFTGLVDGTTYEAGVKAVYDNGSSEMITVTFTFDPSDGENNGIVAVTVLNGNYPNPFNPTTNISFSLKEAGNVTLEVYNAKGQKVKTLVNGEMAADNHVVTWNGDDNNGKKVSSGIYFYKMHSKKYTETKKMLMIK